MNIKILYTTDCAITIHFKEGYNLYSADWGQRYTNLQDAIDMSEYILRYVYPYCAEGVVIWDADTGEALAEITRDE